ncbi:MAG: glycosyltransferase family 2 protein [Thalassobaculaceae bacterium]|mgnify:FL=1|jgi:glycosyltransferase involved in cell wall biosynthesis|nr:glycosyl transferase [Rhodospirillaceae bacterium]OUU54668.1 MAG: glycosyl transferase [Candidatus Endolissoclinum sp. TMED55]|tara:strand:- start:1163 stop:2020 length:858 start_codon:yes stop_codon:yes gene_type:complete
MMNVSAVIPTFNRGHCLLRAINSVLAQTTPVDEIIVVDDGSDDKTYDLLVKSELLDMRGQLPNIRYLYQENKGVSAARNLGIKEAENEYIALLDSDDAWAETKIERQALKLEKKNFSCRITHTEEIWLKDGQRINPKKKHKKSGGFIFEKCLPLCCISPSSVLLHRTLFNDYGFFDEKLPACEDYDMWLRLCAFEEVLFVEEALTIKYGGHADQLSRAFWGMDRFRVLALEKLINSGKLSKTQRSQALEMLVKKIEILLLGAKKREKKEMIQNLDMKLNYWLEMI